MIGVIYLTRKCIHQCQYCNLRNSNLKKPELRVEEWIDAFSILENIGSQFNLILGNEPWLYGLDLLKIINSTKVPTGLYTTCHPCLFNKFRDPLFDGGLDNLSCGIDYPARITLTNPSRDHILQKSFDAWCGFVWTRLHYPNVVCHATITVTAKNYLYLEELVKDLTSIGVFVNINFLHFNKDGQFDFFADSEKMKDLFFKEKQISELRKIVSKVRNIDGVQNSQMLEMDIETLINMGWHCGGDPYGGPTVDADGSLRVCGYRQGSYTPNYTIWDLEKKTYFEEWDTSAIKDSLECPGCSWSCPIMYHQAIKNENLEKVFLEHKG